MFLTEQELKETFWKYYNYKGRAIRHQFEVEVRPGGIDLVTLEKFQGQYQLNAFEFKLQDIKKVILQAKGNLPYVNKSWIVVPAEKEKVIRERYLQHIQDAAYIGVITVEDGGQWKVLHQPTFQKEIRLHQAILNLMIKE